MTDRGATRLDVVGIPPEIAVWLAPVGAEEIGPATAEAAPLSAAEWERAKRFRNAVRRRQFVAGRRLLRALLGELLGVAPEVVPLELTPTGRPVLAGHSGLGSPSFNLSHADELVVVAVARDGRAVGVDVACVAGETDWQGVARRFLSERERAALAALPEAKRRVGFFALWARKEALSKAWPHGAAAPTDGYVVAADPDGPAALLSCEFDPEAPARWLLADLPIGVAGYVGALAYERR